MTRTLRAWLSGDREVARDVQIPSIEEEDAKRIERERKSLVEERTSIIGRIKVRWSRLSEQIFRVDKWRACQG
jgi:transposase